MNADDLARDLTVAFSETPAHLHELHGRLTAAAQQEGILDVAYRTVDTPIGKLLVAATDEGLVRVAFALEGHDAVLQSLADRITPRILEAPRRLDAVAAQLDEYFAKRRQGFDVPLDWRLTGGFRRSVLHHLVRDVAYGHTATYTSLAQLAGSPKAVRAVGSACATNPLPVIVPCHRVVRTDGGMGGYLGGIEVKRTLLTLEAAA
ncbi:MAG: methylated-DNA-[protein]-cysteine S-methyltransferase [Acidimicrobiia bacterium]|jgi:methylated-DNA-[protein]-cysteine S-methyltransferase|nr:methylated-DNA-[protein]-cysteine S-methyltransferase [Acidimicrobiia bacterium]